MFERFMPSGCKYFWSVWRMLSSIVQYYFLMQTLQNGEKASRCTKKSKIANNFSLFKLLIKIQIFENMCHILLHKNIFNLFYHLFKLVYAYVNKSKLQHLNYRSVLMNMFCNSGPLLLKGFFHKGGGRPCLCIDSEKYP